MTAMQYVDETLGSVTCANCGATDEPCAEWCATSDPRSANKNQKLRERAASMTKGSSILPASSRIRLPRGVQGPSVMDEDVEY